MVPEGAPHGPKGDLEMTISSKPTERIVKVKRVLSSIIESPNKAVIYARPRRNLETVVLPPEAAEALGPDLFAYFTAEFVGGHWWLKDRLPDSPNRRW